jgi:hypothetical protein
MSAVRPRQKGWRRTLRAQSVPGGMQGRPAHPPENGVNTP